MWTHLQLFHFNKIIFLGIGWNCCKFCLYAVISLYWWLNIATSSRLKSFLHTPTRCITQEKVFPTRKVDILPALLFFTNSSGVHNSISFVGVYVLGMAKFITILWQINAVIYDNIEKKKYVISTNYVFSTPSDQLLTVILVL